MVTETVTVVRGREDARSHAITIPAELVSDSQYPFEVGDKLQVEILQGTEGLVLTRVREGR